MRLQITSIFRFHINSLLLTLHCCVVDAKNMMRF